MIRRALLGLSLLIAASACGSTVQMRSPREVAAGGSIAGATSGEADALDGTSGGLDAAGATGSGVTPGAATGGAGGASGASAGPTAGGRTAGGAGRPVNATGPIQVGMVLTVTNAQKYGVNDGTTIPERDLNQALIDAYNAKGGIAGRKLEAVFAQTSTDSTNWSTDFQAACATFTQDNHVAVVLGYVFTHDQNLETCLASNGIPHLATGFNVPDKSELARYPLFRSLAVPTIDHRSIAKIQGAVEDGFLTKKSRLAVIYDNCPGTVNSWEKVAKPLLAKHGINVVVEEAGGCGTGNNSSTADAVASVPGAVLQLRQQNVDTIMFLSVSEGPALLVVQSAAEAQGYRPTYITSSLANLSTLEGASPAAQSANVKSYGWMPAQDVGTAQQPPASASQKRCLALLATQNVKVTSFGDLSAAYRICDAVFAYEMALKVNGGDFSGTAVVRGLDGLGRSFESPDVLDGATVFGAGHENNAPARMRLVVFDPGCSCFVYKGATRPLP